jgi:hypothetical protein
MALVIEIVLGLLILASFFVAYMSARTWPIYQVIIAELVFLSAVTFMYLGARTLATHAAWRKLVNEREKQLTAIDGELKQVKEGGPVDPATGQPNPPGKRQLEQKLAKLTTDRGGVFYDAAVEEVKDGTAKLTLKSPDHGLIANSVVFAFDQSKLAEGGRYQGEFKVSSVAENSPTVELVPNLPLTEAQSKRLAASKGPWTLYMTMPIDDAALFAALDEPTRQGLLPADSQAEFAKADRKLTDYQLAFHEHFVHRSLLADSIAKLQIDIQRTEASEKETKTEIGYRETEKGNLAIDSEKFQAEEKAIATYQQALKQQFDHLRESLKSTFANARQRAAQLTADQLRAAADIDRRGRAAAGAR